MTMLLNRIVAYAPTGLVIATLLAILFVPHTIIAPITPIKAQFKSVATQLWPRPQMPPPPGSHLVHVDVQLSDASASLVPGTLVDQHAFENIGTKECAQLLKAMASYCRLEHIYFVADQASASGRAIFGRYRIVPKSGTPSAD